MLKLTYTRNYDKFQTITVLGDAEGIRDLYWQLTHNYKVVDGTAIGEIEVTNLDGLDVMDRLMSSPHAAATYLSRLER